MFNIKRENNLLLIDNQLYLVNKKDVNFSQSDLTYLGRVNFWFGIYLDILHGIPNDQFYQKIFCGIIRDNCTFLVVDNCIYVYENANLINTSNDFYQIFFPYLMGLIESNEKIDDIDLPSANYLTDIIKHYNPSNVDLLLKLFPNNIKRELILQNVI